MASGGDWLLLRELLERGDHEFVDRLRVISDAADLGRFAERWYADPSPNARRLLLAYLERPLNAYRHEALVKRLFKQAEASSDDAVMARLLVALDRSIRRVIRKKHHYESAKVDTISEAENLAAQWKAQGFDKVTHQVEWSLNLSKSPPCVVKGTWSEPFLATSNDTTMPRGVEVGYPVGYDWGLGQVRIRHAPDWVGKLKLDPRKKYDKARLTEGFQKKLEQFQLFSVSTRHYLRRRVWRYFRRLGKSDPDRYVAAISEALILYEDQDVSSGLAFLDNWGLIHALFHHSPVLDSRVRGWRLAENRSLSELEPAPIYESLWQSDPRSVYELMIRARSRPVRQWALRMLRRDPSGRRNAVSIEDLFGLLGHSDPDLVVSAIDWLRDAGALLQVNPEQWLSAAEAASHQTVDMLAELMAELLTPSQIEFGTAARLAASRQLPLARLGLNWLKTKTPTTDSDRSNLLMLLEANAEPIRPELLAWLRSTLASSADYRSEWVLDFLDSRHKDARIEGMNWFRAEPRASEDVTLWQRLLESPYDDVRLELAVDLEARLAKSNAQVDLTVRLDPVRLRLLWSSVLLSIHRGGRIKPQVFQQVTRQLQKHPQEAEMLLPLLGIGLRSLRAPEQRTGLSAVVRLIESRPELLPLIKRSFPELQWV